MPLVRDSWPGARRRAPLVVLGLGLLAQTLVLVHFARQLWFFGDDWEFLLGRSLTHDTVDNLLRPHNEHWSTLPVLAFRALFAVFGIGHYLPYALLPIGAHLVVSVLLYLLLRRTGVAAWPATTATLVAVLAAAGAGAENPLWAFQIGFTGSAAFGVLALLLLAGPRSRPWPAAGALALGLMCSGMGLPMTLWAVVTELLHRGIRRAALVAVVPAVVYLAWYAAFGRGSSGAPDPVLTLAPAAALRGLAGVWTAASGMEGAGPAILLAMAAGTVLIGRRLPVLFAYAAGGLVTLVLAFALFGYARSGLGETATLASRYAYFGVLFTAPALAAVFVLVADRIRLLPNDWAAPLATTLAVGVAGALLVSQSSHFVTERNATGLTTLPARLNAALDYAPDDPRLVSGAPDPVYSPDINLARLHEERVSSTMPQVRPGAQNLLEVQTALQTGIRPQPTQLPSFPTASWAGFAQPTGQLRKLTTCRSAVAGPAASVTFPPMPNGGQARLTVAGPAVQTRLIGHGRASRGSPRHVTPGAVGYAVSTVPDVTFRVYVPPGRVTVCPA